MKKLLMMATFFVVALVTTFTLTSCGDDDDTEYQATETSVLGTWEVGTTGQSRFVITLNSNKEGTLYVKNADGTVQYDGSITWYFTELYQSTVYVMNGTNELCHFSNLTNIGSKTLTGYYTDSSGMTQFSATKK